MTKAQPTGGGWKLTGASAIVDSIPSATEEQQRAAVRRVVKMADNPHDAAMLLQVLGLVETAKAMRRPSSAA
jgi:hypothetical protein